MPACFQATKDFKDTKDLKDNKDCKGAPQQVLVVLAVLLVLPRSTMRTEVIHTISSDDFSTKCPGECASCFRFLAVCGLTKYPVFVLSRPPFLAGRSLKIRVQCASWQILHNRKACASMMERITCAHPCIIWLRLFFCLLKIKQIKFLTGFRAKSKTYPGFREI